MTDEASIVRGRSSRGRRVMMEATGATALRPRVGGHERRSAERYESRVESVAKDAQRAAVRDWLVDHHPPGSRMRLLSMPDEHWTFENRLNDDRPDTSFFGLQRDWTTLERSVPWIPRPQDQPSWSGEGKAEHFYAKARTGDVQGYRRGNNVVLFMWAGHMLSWENIDRRKKRGKGTDVDLKSRNKKGLRHVTAAWLDFTGFLTDEVTAAVAGIPSVLGGTVEAFPVVATFLACRDAFSDHEARVAQFLIALQRAQRPRSWWRFRYDHFSVHTGTSPFVSVFGSYNRTANPSRAAGRDYIV